MQGFDIPSGATQKLGTSGSVANAAAAASLAADANAYNWLSGFDVTGGGATAAVLVVITVTGLLGGTITFVMAAVAGVTLPVRFEKSFMKALRSSAKNTAIQVSAAAFGAGNTAVVTNVYGYSSEL